MKIGFDAYFDETPLFLEVGRALEENWGASVSAIIMGARWSEHVGRHGFRQYNISDFIKARWGSIRTDAGSLRSWDRKYGGYGLEGFIAADRFISAFGREHALKLLIGHLMFFEDYVEAESPDVVVNPGVAFLAHLACHAVCSEKGVGFFSLYTSSLPAERFAVSRNCRNSWDTVNRVYHGLKARGLSTEERKSAEEFIRRFREGRPKPVYMRFSWQRATVNSAFVKEFFRRFGNYYLRGWGRDYDYITKSPFYYAWRDTSRIFRGWLVEAAGTFEKPADGARYALFPLHLQPEASTLVLAPYYVNQLAAVENVARSLPLTHSLYIKEHFSSIGRRPRGYYRELKKNSNAALISPHADIHELIGNADCVVVLSSTMGWEALLYEKPVVSLGDAFYNDSGLVKRVHDLHRLPDALKEAVERPHVDREDLLKFVAAINMGTHKGKIYLPHISPDVLEDENVMDIAAGIMKEASCGVAENPPREERTEYAGVHCR